MCSFAERSSLCSTEPLTLQLNYAEARGGFSLSVPTSVDRRVRCFSLAEPGRPGCCVRHSGLYGAKARGMSGTNGGHKHLLLKQVLEIAHLVNNVLSENYC